MKYLIYNFYTRDENERDWLVALLSQRQFEGFEETSELLKAYIREELMTSSEVDAVLQDNDLHHIRYEQTELEERNWNEEWEKNFDPVVIDDRVGIRAPFHAPLHTAIEIVIEPKMSFGTGHHATTASMVRLMLNMDFTGKSVLDFGSGTGVLAILAEKLNAAKVVAIDNEDWAYRNAQENTLANNCVHIRCLQGDERYAFHEKFDIILANINRQVILQNMGKWKTLLTDNGSLLISGILQSDEGMVVAEATSIGLRVVTVQHLNGWLAIQLHSREQK